MLDIQILLQLILLFGLRRVVSLANKLIDGLIKTDIDISNEEVIPDLTGFW